MTLQAISTTLPTSPSTRRVLWDTETGLYYNATRWYDPVLGRFVSFSAISPFEEEEYAFCGNDPVNFGDVNGYGKFKFIRRAIPFRGGPRNSILGWKIINENLCEATAVAIRKRGGNIVIHARNKKEALHIARKIEDQANPGMDRLFHGKDAHLNAGNQPHLQTPGVNGHIFLKYPGSSILRNVTAITTTTYWFGSNWFTEGLDIFNPLSIGQDAVDIYDIIQGEGDTGIYEINPEIDQ